MGDLEQIMFKWKNKMDKNDLKKIFIGFGIVSSTIGAILPSTTIIIIGGLSLFIGEILLILKW